MDCEEARGLGQQFLILWFFCPLMPVVAVLRNESGAHPDSTSRHRDSIKEAYGIFAVIVKY